MKVISKIENVEGLKNFEAVLEIIRSGYQVVRRQEFDWEHFGLTLKCRRFDTAKWEIIASRNCPFSCFNHSFLFGGDLGRV